MAIGITADSFIVYFERIRDEVRDGRTLRVAAETGWIRARRTLLAADFVSLLGAVVLYILSIGSVRGFAFALGLTTVIDVLVAFTFTRPVVALLAGTRFFQSGHPLSGVDPEATGHPRSACAAIRGRRREESSHVPIGSPRAQALLRRGVLRHRRQAPALVRDLRLPSSSSPCSRWSSRGLNLGIEFTGGAEYQVPSAPRAPSRRPAAAVEAVGVEPSTVTQLGNDLIRVTTEAVDNATSLKIRGSLAQACAVEPDEVSVQLVGPTWGGEITQKAITALLVFLGAAVGLPGASTSTGGWPWPPSSPSSTTS